MHYKFKCRLGHGQCYGHSGNLPGSLSRREINSNLLELGFTPGQCPVLGQKEYHSGNSGSSCSYMRICVNPQGNDASFSWDGNGHCNSNWRQLASSGTYAPDYTLCGITR